MKSLCSKYSSTAYDSVNLRAVKDYTVYTYLKLYAQIHAGDEIIQIWQRKNILCFLQILVLFFLHFSLYVDACNYGQPVSLRNDPL